MVSGPDGNSNPQAVAEWFERRAALAGGRPAVTFNGTTWSYDEMQRRILGAADAMYANGVRKGDRIGILTLNRPDVLVLLFAAARLGAISVPINFRLTAPELRYVIVNAGLHSLFVGPEHVEVISALEPELPCKFYAQFESGPTDWPLYEDFIGGKHPRSPKAPIDGNDVCTILYTSGTTGAPKGAMITHGNVWLNNINWMLAFGITGDDVMLSVAPMFHAGGLFANVLAVLELGGHVVMLPAFDPGAFLAAIPEFGVTMTFGVPTMILALTQHESFAATDLTSLRYFIAGGAPCPESLLRVCNRAGIPVSHAYGMTEATSVTTILETSLALEKVGSVGRAVMLGESRLVDAEGNIVTAPEVKAEVHVRGGHIFAGYWQNPGASVEAFTADGWFRTGDVGYLDADGFLYVCDRVKDMIISGGENIYPAEVESVLLEHPAVLNAAVVGAADPQWGETVVAAVVLRPGHALDIEQIREFCGPKLARYKLPRRLHLMEALPLNGAGKILKAAIREIVANEKENA